MSSIIDRVKNRVIKEEAPPATQVFEKQNAEGVVEVKSEIDVQPIVATKTIKQNIPGTPLMGFTLETLTHELGVVFEKAMHSAGISSVNAELFGVFHTAGIVPNGFTLVEDEYTGQEFYVLNSSNRMTEIYKSLVKALSSSSSEVISFPYTVDTTLELPMNYVADKEDFEYQTINTKSLYLTPKEIQDLNYKFITEIQFCEKIKEDENSIDLLAMRINREEWKAAPYRQ